MNLNAAIPLALHELASTVWVGGMFFAIFAVRPTLKGVADPAQRVRLAIGIFRRFFPWVWVAITTLWVSGFWISVAAYGKQVGLHVHIMMGIALVMTLIFAWIFAFPHRQMIRIADGYENWGWAAAKLSVVRKLMAVNLALGMLNVVVGAIGPALEPAVRVLFKG